MLEGMPQETKRLDYVDLKLSQKRQVKLRTCADVYAHWRAYKRAYKKAPREGVEFHIDYIDTGLAMSEEERSRAPVALALHGAPGSYHDFSLLIQHLAQQRVRVIAPNFPEYIATVKTKVLFRHSADEKAAYLRDFLCAINVKTIDLLVSHSSAIFPTLLILLNANKKAIECQKRARQQQQQQQRQGKARPQQDQNQKKIRASDQDKELSNSSQVSVESFSEIGQQLKQGIAGAGDLDEGMQQQQQQHRHHQHHQREQQESLLLKEVESFEDASDELDDNNNATKRHEASVSSGVSTANISELVDVVDQQQVASGSYRELERAQQESIEARATPATSETTPSLTTDVEPAKRQKHDKKKSSQRGGRRSPLEPIVKFDEPIEIRAVALFNPAGHRMPKSMKPVWFKCGAVHVYQQKLGRSIFRKFGPAFLTVIGEVVRVENMDHVMLSATVMRNSKCQRVVNQLEQLSQMKIPTLLVFSENDKLIEREIFYEMTQFMHLDPKNFDVFQNEADVELSQSRNVNDWIRVMVFKAGGHYAYSNYAKTVNNAVSELLNKVVGRPQSTPEADGGATVDAAATAAKAQ